MKSVSLKESFPIWVAPTLVVFAVGTVWLRLAVVRTSYEITQSEHQIKNLREEREKDELKLASLKSPRRLEGLAKAKFNLSPPRADQVVHLR